MPSPSIFRSPASTDSGASAHRRNDTHDTVPDMGNLSFDHNEALHHSSSSLEDDLQSPLSTSSHNSPPTITSPVSSMRSQGSRRSAGDGSRRGSLDSPPVVPKVASHEPIPHDNSTEESVQHTSLLVRLMHHRPTQIKAVLLALAVVGLAVGLTFGLQGSTGQGGEAAMQSGSTATSSAGDGEPGKRPSSGGDEFSPDYYPEEEPPQDVVEPSSSSSPSSPSSQEWTLGMHLPGEPTITATLGSSLSFSADGTRLAVSAFQSSTVQVMKVNANGRWKQIGDDLPGRVAALSGDGTRVAVADSTESTVRTYELDGTAEWTPYGSVLTDLWGAQDVTLDHEGTTLAVSHHPDPLCRICPSVATVYALDGSEENWMSTSDILGAYDFDFTVSLSSDGQTLGFSGRVYNHVADMEMNTMTDYTGGNWDVKSDFPDFISGHTALSKDGTAAAVSLPDCHVFKDTDPNEVECTNLETHEVSVMEYRDEDGGWWNRRGVSIGPLVEGHLGATALSLSQDGTRVAVAVGARGMGGENAVGGGLEEEGGLGDAVPMGVDENGPLRRRLSSVKKQGNNKNKKNHKMMIPKARREQGMTDEDLPELSSNAAYETEDAYVRVYNYDATTGAWSTVGSEIPIDASGSTVELSSDGTRLAVGVPYGGEGGVGYVKVYDLA